MTVERVKRNASSWEPTAAFACFVGSILFSAFGFVFTTEWLLSAQRHPVVHGIGILLLIVAIPVMIFGGHFLDLRDKKMSQSHRELSG